MTSRIDMLKSLAQLLVWLSFTTVPAVSLANQYRWEGVERIVAMSDPHGAYDATIRTLQNADVIDQDRNWSGGATHLVVTGDLLDRGAESRKIMDLVMRLEVEAAASGGVVHLTLGNHEVMNLVGDLRYVVPGEYAAFADEETEAEREHWFALYRAERQAFAEAEMDVAALRAEFERKRPPGFYAHRRAFGSNGQYGRWLMQKPLLIVLNDTAFVHGGLPELIAETGLSGINESLLSDITNYVVALETLVDAGQIDPAANFYDHPQLAEKLIADGGHSQDVLAALITIVNLNQSSVHKSSGPIWYRGDVGCSAMMEGDVLTEALQAIGASRVAIGHTPTVTRQVLSRFDGRVIEIDTGMQSSAYRGSGNALILDKDGTTVVNESNTERVLPTKHPRRVGVRADHLSKQTLEQFLATAEIISKRTDDAGRTIVQLSLDNETMVALFVESPRRKPFAPALAAYRLDNLLRLDMVPVTVAREIDGLRGTLQFMPGNTRDEVYRAQSGEGSDAWCPLSRQWNSMYVFDVLIQNEGRALTSMLYSRENWQLLLIENVNTFSTRAKKPKYLADAPLALSNSWIDALIALNDETLKENLGDILDKRRIAALAKRRDLLLSDAAE